MKLYFSKGACSLSVRIALLEAGLPFTPVLASTKTHQLEDGTDYYTLNPKGYVPMLELDDGQRLTEVPAVLQWVADQAPQRELAPPAGTLPRYRLMEWLSFTGSELHKGFGLLFTPVMPDEAKAQARTKLLTRFQYVERELADGRRFLLGDGFTVADAYLFVVSRWSEPMKVDLVGLPNLAAWRARVGERPMVQQALGDEGLLKP